MERRGHDRRRGPVRVRAGHAGRGHDLARRSCIKQSASSQTLGYSHTVGVEVAPGATARLTMGGTGRPVIGKVTTPAEIAGPIDWTYSHNNLIPKETPIQAADPVPASKADSEPHEGAAPSSSRPTGRSGSRTWMPARMT